MKELAAEHGVDTNIDDIAARLATSVTTSAHQLQPHTDGRAAQAQLRSDGPARAGPLAGTPGGPTCASTSPCCGTAGVRAADGVVPGQAAAAEVCGTSDDDGGMLDFEEERLSAADHARLQEGLWLLEKAFQVVRGTPSTRAHACTPVPAPRVTCHVTMRTHHMHACACAGADVSAHQLNDPV